MIFSNFSDLLDFYPRDLAWALEEEEEEEEEEVDDDTKLEHLFHRAPRPLWEFLEEEGLCRWFGNELAAGLEMREMNILYLEQKEDQKKA